MLANVAYFAVLSGVEMESSYAVALVSKPPLTYSDKSLFLLTVVWNADVRKFYLVGSDLRSALLLWRSERHSLHLS